MGSMVMVLQVPNWHCRVFKRTTPDKIYAPNIIGSIQQRIPRKAAAIDHSAQADCLSQELSPSWQGTDRPKLSQA
jgi:hypothetical protein